MTTTSTVRLTEVAAALGQSIGYVRGRLAAHSITTVSDWAGEPAVTVEDARRFVEAVRAEAADHNARWDAYVRDCEQWTAAHTAAVQSAYRHARDHAPGHLSSSGTDGFAREAATRAGAEYERSTPRPEWENTPGYGNHARLEYLREDELTPILGRVRAARRRHAEDKTTTNVTEVA